MTSVSNKWSVCVLSYEFDEVVEDEEDGEVADDEVDAGDEEEEEEDEQVLEPSCGRCDEMRPSFSKAPKEGSSSTKIGFWGYVGVEYKGGPWNRYDI